MYLCDLHLHSGFSPDGSGTVSEMCEKAAEDGLCAVAFTEHWDVTEHGGGEAFYNRKDAHIRRTMADAKTAFSGRLRVLYGIELGQPHHNIKAAADFLRRHRFDFVLGSVHNLRGGTDIYYVKYKDGDDVRAILSRYLDEILEMTDTGMINSLAHLDYPLRVMNRTLCEPSLIAYRLQIDEILKKAVSKNTALEINTKSLVSWHKRLFPEQWTLARYRELGGEMITVGSDSHGPDGIGFGVRRAMDYIKQNGFSYVTVFEEGNPQMIRI